MSEGVKGEYGKEPVICLGAYALSIQNKDAKAAEQHLRDIIRLAQEKNIQVIDSLAEAFTAAVNKSSVDLKKVAKQFGGRTFHDCDNCPILAACTNANKAFIEARSQMIYTSSDNTNNFN